MYARIFFFSFFFRFYFSSSLMQRNLELLIPIANAHLEFLALIKIILFIKKGNSTIVFSFLFFHFCITVWQRMDDLLSKCQLPKNRKNKNKNKNNKKEKIDKKKTEKKIETKNASLKLDRLRYNNSFLWEKKPSFNNVISKRHTHRREAKSAIFFNSKWCSRCRFCDVFWIFFEERKLRFVLTQHSWKSAIMRQW